MQDRRDYSKSTITQSQSSWNERRVRILDRRKHTSIYRIIHIDMRDMWGFLASKWRPSN
jgi:hypothetical protein